MLTHISQEFQHQIKSVKPEGLVALSTHRRLIPNLYTLLRTVSPTSRPSYELEKTKPNTNNQHNILQVLLPKK